MYIYIEKATHHGMSWPNKLGEGNRVGEQVIGSVSTGVNLVKRLSPFCCGDKSNLNFVG